MTESQVPQNGARENGKVCLQGDYIEFSRGKYFIKNTDREVYVQFPLGPVQWVMGCKVPAGHLPNPRELAQKGLPILINKFYKEYPRLMPQINGLLVCNVKYGSKKEQTPQGHDSITTEEAIEMILQPCRYVPASGEKRNILEDIFGDIF